MTAGRAPRSAGAAATLAAAVLGGAWLAACASAAEFPQRGVGRPSFLVNAVALPEGPDSVGVRVTWEIPYGQLTFRQEDEWYRARYDVTVVLTRGGRQVAGDVWDRHVRAKTFEDTRSSRLAKGRETLVVPPGVYDLRVTVTDRTSRSTSVARAEVEAAFGSTRIGLSEIRFVRYTGSGAEPNPGRDIPVGQSGNVAQVVLHPDLADEGSYVLRWRVEDEEDEAASGDTTVVLHNEPVMVELPVAAENLTVGAHRLEVRLQGAGGGEHESRRTTFFVRLTPTWFTTQREQAQDVFDLIAPGDEARALEDAAPSEWAAAVEAFWARHDPDPRTARNEFREEIHDRMEAAATLFDEPFRRHGWRTDRGQVFLRHGPPVRRTVRSADFEGPASELWEYESPRRLFFFVDERGTGEFFLRS
jgi:GWxTD domain-containing protein